MPFNPFGKLFGEISDRFESYVDELMWYFSDQCEARVNHDVDEDSTQGLEVQLAPYEDAIESQLEAAKKSQPEAEMTESQPEAALCDPADAA